MNAVVRKLRPAQNSEPELVPSLESVWPTYAEQRELRDSLQHKLHALTAERDRVGTENYAPQNQQSEARARNRRILSLLGRTASPEEEAPTSAERMTALFHEISEVEEGIRITDARLRAEALAASRLVCQQIRPEYERLVRNLIKVAIELHNANREYTALADTLNAKGINWSYLAPLFPRFAGEPKDPCTELRYFFKEAIEDGWITADDLPADIRADFPKPKGSKK